MSRHITEQWTIAERARSLVCGGGTAVRERSWAIKGAPAAALYGVDEGSRASRQTSGLVVDHVKVALNPEPPQAHAFQPSGL